MGFDVFHTLSVIKVYFLWENDVYMIKRIKDFINKHKIRKQVEQSWEEKPVIKLKVSQKPEYNINNIMWFQTVIPNVSVPYFYNREKDKPLEQYVEYSGINSYGYVEVNQYLETIN